MQRKYTILTAAVMMAFSSILPASAENPLPQSTDTLVPYGEVDGWTIYHNQTRGHCLLVTADDSGAVQLGVTADNEELGYLGVFTKFNIGLQQGTKSEIFVSLDGNVYSGVSTVVSEHLKDGFTGGYILTDNPDFKRDFAKKYEMTVFPQTPGTFVVDLKGTLKAMKMTKECFKKFSAS